MSSFNTRQEKRPEARPADLIIKQSGKQMSAMSVISSRQVKLWKALLIGFFLAGFVGSLTLLVGVGIGLRSEAGVNNAVLPQEGNDVHQATNLAPLMQIKSRTYAAPGDEWDNLVKPGVTKIRTGGEPWVEFRFKHSAVYEVSKIRLGNPSSLVGHEKCGLKDFTVKVSQDGKSFSKLTIKDSLNLTGARDFALSNVGTVSMNALRLYLNSNHGNDQWMCLDMVGIY